MTVSITTARVAPEKADFRPALLSFHVAGFLPEKAMPEKSYFEKLKDPRWQRKRLQILDRNGFACEFCGSKTKTLHVHHKFYVKGREPWEYDDEALEALCEDCHADRHALRERLDRALAADCVVLEQIVGYAEGAHMLTTSDDDDSVRYDVFSYEHAMGIGDAFGVSADEVIALATILNDKTVSGASMAALRKLRTGVD